MEKLSLKDNFASVRISCILKSKKKPQAFEVFLQFLKQRKTTTKNSFMPLTCRCEGIQEGVGTRTNSGGSVKARIAMIEYTSFLEIISFYLFI